MMLNYTNHAFLFLKKMNLVLDISPGHLISRALKFHFLACKFWPSTKINRFFYHVIQINVWGSENYYSGELGSLGKLIMRLNQPS